MKLILLALVLLQACANLQPDPVKPAIESGYMSVEFSACNKDFLGIGTCAVKPNTEVTLKLQTYLNGTITIDSESCGLHENLRYSNSEVISIPLPALETCLVDFVMSVEFPEEQSSGLKISPLKGRFNLFISEYEATIEEEQIQEGIDTRFRFRSDIALNVVVEGCGASYSQRNELEHGFIIIRLSKLVPLKKRNCFFVGAIGNNLILWDVNMYDMEFIPLPTPTVGINNEKVTLEASKEVSIIITERGYKVSNTATFKYIPQKIRLLTVGGRTAVGTWNGKRYVWMN